MHSNHKRSSLSAKTRTKTSHASSPDAALAAVGVSVVLEVGAVAGVLGAHPPALAPVGHGVVEADAAAVGALGAAGPGGGGDQVLEALEVGVA